MELLLDPAVWMALFTLTVLEIVLGIDNVVFISVLVARLPKEQQQKARLIGLSLAMVLRILLLLALTWIMKLETTLFSVLKNQISGRDIILIFGGFFLLAKATMELHASTETNVHQNTAISAGFSAIIVQIALIDIVFSLDSVITAVGMAQHIEVMVVAIIIAVLVMMLAAKSISDIIEKHPTLKVLALSFLLLIGTALIADGLDMKIPKGYLYFAMAFSVMVELFNIRSRKAISRQNLIVPLSEEDNIIRGEN